jgi:hypothetical protein
MLPGDGKLEAIEQAVFCGFDPDELGRAVRNYIHHALFAHRDKFGGRRRAAQLDAAARPHVGIFGEGVPLTCGACRVAVHKANIRRAAIVQFRPIVGGVKILIRQGWR